MDTLTGHDAVEHARTDASRMRARVPTLGARVGRFALHAAEMCAAMCVGAAVLDPLYVWGAGRLGVADPLLALPDLSVLVLAFNMTAPMVAWMRFRGMDWRSINEMSAAMVVEAFVVIAAYRLGMVGNVRVGATSTLWQLQHALMMPAMLVPMLLRLDRYTVHTHHRRRGG
jgi:hypothetical protein